jgi:hypothetical protein
MPDAVASSARYVADSLATKGAMIMNQTFIPAGETIPLRKENTIYYGKLVLTEHLTKPLATTPLGKGCII